CPTCGDYDITNGALQAKPDHFVEERLHLISAVARWSSEGGNTFLVLPELLQDRSEFEARILSVCPRNTQEKLDRILAYIAEKASYPGEEIVIEKDSISPLFYCKNVEEVELYLKYLQTSNLADFIGPKIGAIRYKLALTVEGLKKAQEQAKPNIESKQAFVAMWFDESLQSAYSKGIAKLEEDTGFNMLRIDMKQFNDKICDRILAEIKRSRFLIADVTKHRQGVYFEAGFAMGMGLPVIWTCRKDQIEGCHFDTRQYNHITWNNEVELREKLRDRIIATVGMAPK
ncbi:MAG: hypothetical protein WBC05_25770, partial [Sedimentisphaerales bacterium]